MTSLRFAGDVPVWLGLGLAFVVCLLSWRYYNRESFDLPRRQRWLLPFLRSAAFFLGIMILTGPVLHHRTIIGELGRVKLYVDGSRSMTMLDRHMSTGRKLLIAEQLGWLSDGHVDTTLLKVADKLTDARLQFLRQSGIGVVSAPEDGPSRASTDRTTASADLQRIRDAVVEWKTQLQEVQTQLPPVMAERLKTDLLAPLETATASDDAPAVSGAPVESVSSQWLAVMNSSESLESAVQEEFDRTISDMMKSGDKAIQAALTLFDETPRWRRVELGLSESAAKLLATLKEQHEVEVIRLSGTNVILQGNRTSSNVSDVQRQSVANSDDADPAKTFSSITDLSTGIVATQKSATMTDDPASEATIPSSVARTAIVLLTDGQHNSGPSPLQMARVLGAQGMAFYGVSIGATQQAADLAVIKLEHPDLVFQKDTVRGVMVISDVMPAGQPFVAQIRHDNEVLWQQQLLSQNVGERRIEFEFRIAELIKKLGAPFGSDLKQHSIPLVFEASLTPLAEESETDNNQQTMRLAAIVESHRLLIIDGRSRWETRYLRNAFERDSQWSVNTIIAGPGTDDAVLRRGDQDGAFPTTRDALFQYDLVIFGEISPDLLTETDFEWLREFVETRGGGMIFVDGQRGELQKLPDRGAGSLLPVEWLPEVITTRPVRLQLTDRGAAEAALSLATDPQQNRRFWTELPAPHSLVAVSAMSGSEVLAETLVGEKVYPAILTRQVGAGRVLYMAFDESWRWRYKAADTWHQRIWNQLAGYVMPRPFAASDDYVSIDTGNVRYDFGDSIDVRVRLLDLEGKPELKATAEALVWKDGRIVSTASLTADGQVPGIYRGQIASLPEGGYEVSVRASGYSDAVLKARSQFVVLPPVSGEMTQTAANETLLKQMAAASGGAFLREEELSRLPELLAPLSSGRVVESDSLIWQSYWWFAAIVILLTAEWMLRKRAGLL